MKILGNPIRLCYLNKLMDYVKNNFLILEIGSFMGSSLLTMAEGLYRNNKKGKIIAVEPFDDFFKNILVDIDEEGRKVENDKIIAEFYKTISLIKENFDIDIIHIKGYSFEVMQLLKDKSFDLIYIDGDHSYNSVKQDILLSKKLIKEEGIICGDDLEFEYEELKQRKINPYEYKNFYAKKINNYGYHPGVTVAVWEEFKKVKNYYGFWINKNLDLIPSIKNIPSHLTLYDVVNSYLLTPHKLFENFISPYTKKVKGYVYPYNTVAKQAVKENILEVKEFIDSKKRIKNAKRIKNDTIIITSFRFLEKILNEIDESNDIYYVHWENLNLYKINKKIFNSFKKENNNVSQCLNR